MYGAPQGAFNQLVTQEREAHSEQAGGGGAALSSTTGITSTTSTTSTTTNGYSSGHTMPGLLLSEVFLAENTMSYYRTTTTTE